MPMFSEMNSNNNLYEYHAVFASSLALYLNVRKELDSDQGKSMASTVEAKRREALSIIKSNMIYAIMLKRTDIENQDIPTTPEDGLVEWINKKIESLSKKGYSPNDVIDTMFAIMVRKQEVAGLTANSEKNQTSRMNMLISQVERDSK